MRLLRLLAWDSTYLFSGYFFGCVSERKPRLQTNREPKHNPRQNCVAGFACTLRARSSRPWPHWVLSALPWTTNLQDAHQ